MTVQEYQAKTIEDAAKLLAHFLLTTVEDKRDWKPDIEGAAGLRSALDQVGECILVNRMIARILLGGQPPAAAPMHADRPFTGVEEASEMLIESGKELGDAIRQMSDEDLEREYPARRGPTLGTVLIAMPLRNMSYHSGQINMLQMCYGDPEYHVPTPPKKD